MNTASIRNSKGEDRSGEFTNLWIQTVRIGNKMTYQQMENSTEIEESGIETFENGSKVGPVLCKKALYGLAGEFVALATENSEADPAAVLATFLVRFSVECGPGPFLMVGDTKHHARLFAVIVGASSKARKGTSAKPVERLFDFELMNEAREDWEPILTAKHSPGPLSTGEGLIYAVRDAQEEWRQDRKTGNGNMVVVDPGVEDKRLYVIDEEFASALSCTKREGNTLSAILRSSWDSGNIEPLTKTSRIKATGAHIGICTHITVEELHQRLSEVEVFNGFANRFVWVYAKRSKIVPFPIPMPEQSLFLIKGKLADRLRSAARINQMQFNDASRSLWNDVYEDLSRDRYGLVGTVLNRAEAQAIRLSMVYALLDGSAVIERWHLEAALLFWDYCSKSAEYIFKKREADAVKGKIIAALKSGPKTKTDLYRALQNSISQKVMDNALNTLISDGRIVSRKEKTGGKPKIVYAFIQ